MRNHLVVVVVLIALSGTTAASADTTGFRRAPRLEPAASWVAGKPVHVWCATSKAVFANAAGVSTGNVDAAGFATVGTQDEYLPPIGCASLLAWLNHRHVEDYTFAVAAFVLAHEATHLRGVAGEASTDCAALSRLPTMIRKFFPIRRHDADLPTLLAYAHDAHDRETAAYHSGPCG